ncbi:MAG TPA: RDD family protein [Planctomycetaceae bacterium]|nr:RDD family protein [Planctomycetaceae bacterium]
MLAVRNDSRKIVVEFDCGYSQYDDESVFSMSQLQKLKVDTRVVVETPEGADFQFVIAGAGTRAIAWLIDMLIKIGVSFAVVMLSIFLVPFGEAGTGLGEGGILFISFLLDWFYGSLFEAYWNGQTPGKRSQGLRVVRTNGTPIDPTSAIGRNFLRVADMLPLFYTVGMISMLMTRRLQRLGDVFFDTMVIDERREWISRAGGLTANIEPLPRAECPRRYSVPERTLAVIERLFESDRIISEARREEIARPLSEALRKRLGYVDPQPDPRNPHTFFRTQGFRHTLFLLRVLKTFAENPTGAKSTPAATDNGSDTSVATNRKNRFAARTADDLVSTELANFLADDPGSRRGGRP